MIWGDEELASAPQAIPAPRPGTPDLEDWEVVGGEAPCPGNLAALDPLEGSAGSSPTSSSSGSESGEVEPAAPRSANRGRPDAPTTRLAGLAAAEAKSAKSAQLVKQRATGKSLSSKALNRSHKCLLASGGRRTAVKSNFPVKMAGKNLKQC